MLTPKLIALATAGLVAGACAGPYDRQVSSQSPSTYQASRAASLSERNCLDYGFTAGTAPYDRCLQRESRARQTGRVSSGYGDARVLEDARSACSDYGVERGTQLYDNCVSRELDARRYRNPTHANSPAPPHDARDVTMYGDDFGVQYDSYGNRIDRAGLIVGPRITTR